MKIAICEDATFFSKQIEGYVNEWAIEKKVFVDIFAYETAEEFLYEWNEREDYDIIFLDIIMGRIDGMELAKIIRKTNDDVALVFVTNMREYISEGYEFGAIHFLTKPAKREKIFACLDRANQIDRIKRYFFYEDLEKSFRIPHEDILYIEKFGHSAEIVTAKGRYAIRKTMAQLLEELDDKIFAQCHRSYIINMRRIKYLHNDHIVMSDETEISLAKNMAKEINKKFHKV